MLRYILALILLCLYSCGGNNSVIHAKHETILFRSSEHNLIFSLQIDNDFKYYDSLLNKNVALAYAIGTYKKKKDSSIIHLRINDKDTIFKYALFEIDSILFGLTQNRNVYIVTNRNKNAWVID
jgi:hypothetical protein